jgi:hypothetical protein
MKELVASCALLKEYAGENDCCSRRSPDSITEPKKQPNNCRNPGLRIGEVHEHQLQRQAMQRIYVWRILRSVRGRRLLNMLKIYAAGQINCVCLRIAVWMG